MDLARAATLSLLLWGCNALLGIEQRELVEGSGATNSGGSESGGKSNNAGTGDTSSGGDDAGAGEPGSGVAGDGSAGSATGGTDGTAGSSGGTDGTSGSPPTGGTGGGGGTGGSDSGGGGTGGSGGTDTGPICLDIDGGSTDSASCTTYCADAVAHCSGEASAEGKVPTTPQCKTFCQTFSVPQLCCRAYHAKNAEIAADPHCAHTVGSGLCQ